MRFWLDAPIIGNGFASFSYLFHKGSERPGGHPHNVVLQIAAELGLVGLVLFGLFVWSGAAPCHPATAARGSADGVRARLLHHRDPELDVRQGADRRAQAVLRRRAVRRSGGHAGPASAAARGAAADQRMVRRHPTVPTEHLQCPTLRDRPSRDAPLRSSPRLRSRRCCSLLGLLVGAFGVGFLVGQPAAVSLRAARRRRGGAPWRLQGLSQATAVQSARPVPRRWTGARVATSRIACSPA